MKATTGSHSLYRHFDKKGVLLYVGISLSAVHRAQQHRHLSPWFSDVSKMTVETFETRELALAAENKAIHEEVPLHNIKRPKPPKPQKPPRPPKAIKEPKAPKMPKQSKTNAMDNAKEVIDKKGARFWAETLGIPLSTVRSWRVRGVPMHVLLDDTAAVRALKRAGYRRGGE